MSDAIAMGVAVNLETDEVMRVARFVDDGTGLCPASKVRSVWKSCEDDWPGWRLAVVENDEAKALRKQQELWKLGMSDPGDEMPARIEAHNAEVEAARAEQGDDRG